MRNNLGILLLHCILILSTMLFLAENKCTDFSVNVELQETSIPLTPPSDAPELISESRPYPGQPPYPYPKPSDEPPLDVKL